MAAMECRVVGVLGDDDAVEAAHSALTLLASQAPTTSLIEEVTLIPAHPVRAERRPRSRVSLVD